MTDGRWLIDSTALLRLVDSVDASLWISRIECGLVHMSAATRMEIGSRARTGAAARDALGKAPLAALLVEYLTPAIEDRALEVQLHLTDGGNHQAPSLVRLIIAATAELVGLTLVHADDSFEVISKFTDQRIERLRLNQR